MDTGLVRVHSSDDFVDLRFSFNLQPLGAVVGYLADAKGVVEISDQGIPLPEYTPPRK